MQALCIGDAAPAALALGLGVVGAGVWVGYAVLGVRPLRLTVPVGVLVELEAIRATGAAVPGGSGPPAWAATLVLSAGLAVLAMTVAPGRLRLIGFTLLLLGAVAAIVVPPVIHNVLEQPSRPADAQTLVVPQLVSRGSASPAANGVRAAYADFQVARRAAKRSSTISLGLAITVASASATAPHSLPAGGHVAVQGPAFSPSNPRLRALAQAVGCRSNSAGPVGMPSRLMSAFHAGRASLLARYMSCPRAAGSCWSRPARPRSVGAGRDTPV